MQIKTNNNFSFGKSRKNKYTPHQIKIMKDMKKAAIKNGWRDIYTGDVFSSQNLPTIEHIIPCSFEKSVKNKKDFQINGLDNIFPVGSLGNSERKSQIIKNTILEKPIILKILLQEMEKYKKYKSDLIDGKNWVLRLGKTLTNELEGIASNIKTRQIISV